MKKAWSLESFQRKNVTPVDSKPGPESRISRTMATLDWMPACAGMTHTHTNRLRNYNQDTSP